MIEIISGSKSIHSIVDRQPRLVIMWGVTQSAVRRLTCVSAHEMMTSATNIQQSADPTFLGISSSVLEIDRPLQRERSQQRYC